jgi:hypothetical protein
VRAASSGLLIGKNRLRRFFQAIAFVSGGEKRGFRHLPLHGYARTGASPMSS